MRSRNTVKLSLLFCLALAVRIGACYYGNGFDMPPESDEHEYYDGGVSLYRGLGYCLTPQQSPDGLAKPTAYRMPGASLAIAFGFALFRECVAAARWESIIVASLSAPLMYLVARRVSSPPSPMVAAVACAVYPTWVFNSLAVLAEPYFIPAFLLAMLLTLDAAERKSPVSALLAGLGWGVVTLIRPHGLPMAALTAAYLFRAAGWRASGALLLATVVVLVPWVVRNQVMLGHPVLLATEGGETLLGANNPYVASDVALRGMWVSPMGIDEYRQELAAIHDDVLRDRKQRDLALRYMGAHSEKIPALVANKLWRWLTPVTASGGIVRILVLGSYGVLLILLAVGASRHLFVGSAALHLTLIWTFVLCVLTAIYWGNLTRGRLPLEIAWLPWGAWSAVNLIDAAKAKLFGSSTPRNDSAAAAP
jgi:hypothetical protein